MQYNPYCLFCCFPWTLWQNEKCAGQNSKLWDTCRHALWTDIWRVQVGHSWVTACACIIHGCDYCLWASCPWNPVPDVLDTLILMHTLSAVINWGCLGAPFTVKVWEWVTLKGSQSCPQLAVQEHFPNTLAVMDPWPHCQGLSVCPRPPPDTGAHTQLSPKHFWEKGCRAVFQPRFTPFVHYQIRKCHSGMLKE